MKVWLSYQHPTKTAEQIEAVAKYRTSCYGYGMCFTALLPKSRFSAAGGSRGASSPGLISESRTGYM